MKISYKFCVLLIAFALGLSNVTHCQKIRVIDNKGTVADVNNNNVYTSPTDPNDPKVISVTNDVWIDNTSTPNTIKIFNGLNWINITHTGSAGSVFFAGTDGTPTEDNAQLFWNNTSKSLYIGSQLSGSNKLNVDGTTRTSGLSNSKGTESLPSYRFTDDLNSGMYSPASTPAAAGGILAFSTASVEAIRIDAAQEVKVQKNIYVVGSYKDSNESAGTNGQVLASTGVGTNWVAPTVNTDNQKIDVYALNGDAKNLDLSLENDADATQQVDLSGLAISGDVTGTLAASTVVAIQNEPVSATTPTNGQVLQYDAATNEWVPVTLSIPPPAYEKIVIWAEEADDLNDGNLQWSFGDGDTGRIGIPLPENWEAYAVSFNADNTNGSGSDSVEMAVIDTVTNCNLFTFTASGTADNMVYTRMLEPAVEIPAGTSLGFKTLIETGTINGARVAVFLRRIP